MDDDPSLGYINSELSHTTFLIEELQLALSNLGDGPVYRLIGKVLVKKEVSVLRTELEEELRLATKKKAVLQAQLDVAQKKIKEGLDG